MPRDVESILDRHFCFWERKPADRPLVGFTIGSYFPAHRFSAAIPLLQEGLEIAPEMVNPESFIDDYERLYALSLDVEQDLFWVAEPFTGIPWLEAMLGCPIRGSRDSLWANASLRDWHDFPNHVDLDSNPWFRKYMEFTKMLIDLSHGRFQVGQAILRGPADLLSALRGHAQAVIDLVDSPDQARRVLKVAGEVFIEVVRRQQAAVQPIHRGYAMGFYYLWAPAHVIWLQEDASALLSPRLYGEFVHSYDAWIAETFDYTLFHLHPASFFILDTLLEMRCLKVVQINKDVGGPSISDMLPIFARVLKQKSLMIWGDLTRDDLEQIADALPARGLAFHLVAATPEEARELVEVTHRQKWQMTV